MIVPALLAASGCASTQTARIATMTDDARANEIAATSKYERKRLRVTGIVTDTSMMRFERLEAQTPVLWTGALVVGGPLETRTDRYPVVRLIDSAGRPDAQLACYFPEGDAARAASVQRGARVTLVGRFQEIWKTPQGPELILTECAIE